MLRKGRRAGGGATSALDRSALAAMMIGEQRIATLDARAAVAETTEPVLEIRTLRAAGGAELKSIEIDDLALHVGEIVGVAGIAGNGQRELLGVLAGQRDRGAPRLRIGDPRPMGRVLIAGARRRHIARARPSPRRDRDRKAGQGRFYIFDIYIKKWLAIRKSTMERAAGNFGLVMSEGSPMDERFAAA